MVAPQAHSAPARVADELAWELLRDEWELLLAVGTGPTAATAAAARLGEESDAVERRLRLLARYGLVEERGEGFGLVPVFHERQEGMASFLRDLVIRRLELGSEVPFAGGVRTDLGDTASLVTLADAELLPAVFEAARPPATERSSRFAVFFAVAADCQLPDEAEEEESVGRLLAVLRQAAIERSHSDTRASAKLWVADMRTDPEVAERIANMFEEFLAGRVQQGAATSGSGAAAFAILASGKTRQRVP